MKLPQGSGIFIRRCDGPLMGAIVNLFPYLKDRLHIDWVGIEVGEGMVQLNSTVKLDTFMKHAKNNNMPIWFQHTFVGSDPNEGNKIVARYKKYPGQVKGIILRVKANADQRSINSVRTWYDKVRNQLTGVSIGCLCIQKPLHETLVEAVAKADFGLPLISLDKDAPLNPQILESIARWQIITNAPLIPTTYIFKDDSYENNPNSVVTFHDLIESAPDISGMGYWLYDPEPPAIGVDGDVPMRQAMMRILWGDNPTVPPVIVDPPPVIVIPPTLPQSFKLMIDVYAGNGKLNWKVLKANGVDKMCAKAGFANFWGVWKDSMLDWNMNAALDEGVDPSVYWWNDPTRNWQQQVDKYLQWTEIYFDILEFMCVDVEQYKGNIWVWNQKHTKKIMNWGTLDPLQISQAGYFMMNEIAQRIDTVPVCYTRTTFVMEHAPQMLAWLPLWRRWLAAYPQTRIITYDKKEAEDKGFTYCPDWETYFRVYAPKPEFPIWLPKTCTHWDIWQFSGDRVKLPGSDSYMDLNWVRSGH